MSGWTSNSFGFGSKVKQVPRFDFMEHGASLQFEPVDRHDAVLHEVLVGLPYVPTAEESALGCER